MTRGQRCIVDEFAKCGVATIHETLGRAGLLAPRLRPIYPGAAIAGTAVTVAAPRADNLALHIAVESCRAGDIMVVAPSRLSTDGYFGSLLATALRARGVKGLIIDAGVRDLAALTAMRFPVWCRAVSAQGTTKASVGVINRTLHCAGQRISPGDIIVADDDGVVAIQRIVAAEVLNAAKARLQREEDQRKRLAAGELPIDVFGLRSRLKAGYPAQRPHRASRREAGG